ncbi:MAG: choice-of-anchor tandem repeat GloVer-containing protein [Syntrophobacteraceae bacterium]|jgi:uncharacterized repeat protein (TIGR03803 family)
MIKVRLLSLFAIGGLAVTLIFMIGALGGQADGQMDGPVSAALPPFAVLHSFNPNSGDGSAINWSSLTLSGTTLYGTTADGGANGKGIIFKFDTKKNIETVLYSFAGTGDGANPYGSLTLVGTTLYGMTTYGGANGKGTIFKFDTKKNVETVLYNFGGTGDGAYPQGSFTLVGTTLYGMTNSGGANDKGTIFEFDTKKNVETVLYSFAGTGDGAYPQGSFTLVGTTLYGMTNSGGANDKGTTYTYGTIFKFDTKKNIETVLHSFGGTSDGADPTWSLTLSGTTLYGMTWQGGTSGWGTIFKFDTKKNVETVLYNFGGTSDGANPSTSLILSETTLYGMTCWGGAGATYHGNGTVFAFDTKKNVQTVLYNFRGTSDGTNPFSTSLALLGTTLYGTTSIGGASGAGTIFSIPDLPLSTISGTVESSGLNPEVMDGVTVTLSQSNQTSQTLSDSSGAYSFNDLGPSRYTVTPSLTGYTFTPKSASVSVSGTNLTENFTGAPITISGMVTFNDGPVTTDLTMILSGKATETNPAPSGAYAFGPMMNGSYKVRPALTAHPNPVPQTTPSSATVVINGKSVTQNFTYTTNATCFTAGCHVK